MAVVTLAISKYVLLNVLLGTGKECEFCGC